MGTLRRAANWIIDRAVIATILAIAAATFVLHFVRKPLWLSEDLTGNFFAEAIGIAVTVGLIDAILRIHERKRSRPARFAAYTTANRFLARYLALWHDIVVASIQPQTNTEIDHFSAETMQQIRRTFPIEGHANVLPAIPWADFIPLRLSELTEEIDRCLRRFTEFLDPELLDLFLRLENLHTIAMLKQLRALRQGHQQLGQAWNRGLPADETLWSKDLAVLQEMADLLKGQSREFRNLPGFTHPYEIKTRY